MIPSILARRSLIHTHARRYGNSPNRTFLPQESAIKEISDKVKEVFDAPTGDATLVLLSTYNMGKEKILYKCCVDNGKKIYVVPRKKVLLECVDEGKGGEAYPEGVGEDHLGEPKHPHSRV